MSTSRLQGWDYIKSLIYKCPYCKQRATLGQKALPLNNKKWHVCCMNICCSNFNDTQEYENPYLAIHEWNMKYGLKEEVEVEQDEELD
jgi:hypothetical protein